MGRMSISSAFEGLSMANNSDEPPVSSNRVSSLPSYVPEQEPERTQPPAPQHQTRPSYVHQQPDPVLSETPQPVYNNMTPSVVVAPPLPASGAPAPVTALSSKPPPSSSSSYAVGDTQQELVKLKNVLQKLQAENISLKAQLGNMTDEEKEVQKNLGATISEIGILSTDLGLQRQHVLEAKNRLLEAKAELKAQKDTKSVLKELIGESEQTTSAIEDATEMIRNANQAVANTTNMIPTPTTEIQNTNYVESNDFFGAPTSMTQFNQGQERDISQTPPMEVGMPGGGGGGDTRTSLPSPTSRNSTYSAQGTPSPSQSGLPETGFVGASPMPDGTNDNRTDFAPSSTEHYPSSMMDAHYAAAPPPASYPDPQQHYGAPQPQPPAASYPNPQQNYGVPPPPASYPDPQPNYGAPPSASNSQVPQQQQQLTPNIERPSALATHGRQLSGFESGFMMGGSAPVIEHQQDPDISDDSEQQQQVETFDETFSVAARSHASSGEYGYDDQAFEIVEEMKKKAKQADKNARDNEAASRKLATDAEELRNDADKTEENARSLKAAAEEKKKGRFGGKKYKKLHDSAEQANKDAADIKKRFMAVQTEAYEAATLAATTRSVADRLRDEAESAELQMVSAASARQKPPASTPAPAPAPVPTANNTFATNGGYEMPSPKPSYEGVAPPKQQPSPSPYGQGMQTMMTSPSPATGGYNNYGQQPYGGGQPAPIQPTSSSGASGFAPMGGSGENFTGYDLPDPSTFQHSAPAPGMQPVADPYASPF